jgi:tetratricopeptide (TPR) repeat protein
MFCKECGKQIAEDSKFCQSCGKPQDGTEKVVVEIDNSDKLEKLLKNARGARERDNIEQAKEYYRMVLTEDPENWEAIFYDTYFGAMKCSIAEISVVTDRVAKCIKPVLRHIKKIDDTNRQNKAIKQINADLNKISLMLYNAAINNYNSELAQFIETEKYELEFSVRVLSSANILLAFGNELVSEFGENEFTTQITIQCYKTALDNLFKDFGAKYVDNTFIQQYTDKLRKLDPLYKPPKLETKSENIFADMESKPNKDGSFLTEFLAEFSPGWWVVIIIVIVYIVIKVMGII